MFIAQSPEALMEKWTDPELGKLAVDQAGISYEDQVALAQILENVDTRDMQGQFLTEGINNGLSTVGGLTNGSADANAYQFRPISLALVRRTFPELFANKIAGVQAMATPVGLAYAMRVYYEGTSVEMGWEKVPEYSGFTGSTRGTSGTADAGTGAVASSAEGWQALSGTTANAYPRADIKFDQKTIQAVSRKLAATFSLESIADIKAMLNVDIERQIVDYLNYEVIAEMDREILASVKAAAIDTTVGGARESTAVAYSTTVDCTAGMTYDNTGSKLGRVVSAILLQSEMIALATKRGPGNIVVCSPRVVTALQCAGAPMFNPIAVNVNGTQYKSGGVSLVGTLNGNISVYRDQYATDDYALVAYKGNDNQDAGIVFSPYMMGIQNTAIDPNTFGKILGVMSRYALTSSLYGSGRYYRSIKFTNLSSLIAGTAA